MKKLYVIRHGHALSGGVEDKQRVLSLNGVEQAKHIGKLLFSENTPIDYILSSTATRALDTAKYIAQELHFDINKIDAQSKLYNTSESELLQTLSVIDSHLSNVILVNHNPSITNLVNLLSHNNEVVFMQTCSLAEIALDTDTWQNIHEKSGTLNRLIHA